MKTKKQIRNQEAYQKDKQKENRETKGSVRKEQKTDIVREEEEMYSAGETGVEGEQTAEPEMETFQEINFDPELELLEEIEWKPESEQERQTEPEGMEDNWEDESEPLKPGVLAGVLLGMAVLAVVVCLGLWRFTHPEVQGGENGDLYAGGQYVTAAPEPIEPVTIPQMTPAPSNLSGTEPTPDPLSVSGSEAQPTPDPLAVSGSEAQPTPDPLAVSGSATEPTPDPDAHFPVSGNVAMVFTATQETVTPKDKVNLRFLPTAKSAETIFSQVQNGEVLVRTGINQDTGWSRVEYNGETYYAVSRYLTTDLNYKIPEPPADPDRISTSTGRVIVFTACDDWISPKQYVNLRTEPSTLKGDDTVSCQLNNGEKAHRTGISADSGWSRVEYNGEVLYVVSSLVMEEAEE